jgi:hypothetical protein
MRHLKLFILATLSLVTFNCGTNSHKYSIEVRHFAAAMGLTIYYIVDDKSIKVDTNCDLDNCKRKNVYKRSFTSVQSDRLFQALKSLHLDTLKTSYKSKGMVFDGLVSSIKLRGSEFPNKDISIDNVDLPTTDSLYRILDRLILEKKYQFYHFGEE